MMNATSAPERSPCSADPLVLATPENSSGRAELRSICERLTKVWSDRTHSEGELWDTLRLELAGASTVEEALRAYAENAAQRMRMALEDAQRIFEEHQAIVARFSRPRGEDAPD